MAQAIAGTISAPEFGSSTEFALIIQCEIAARRRGHLANTRRVSRDRRTWLFESEESDTAPAVAARIRGTLVPAEPSALTCRREADLAKALREVATFLRSHNRRFHCEWVWDGTRVYVVQADDEVTRPTARPGAARVLGLSSIDPARLECLIPALSATENWSKLECVRILRELGLPHGEVYALEGGAVAALADGVLVDSLARDLAYFTKAPTVIRSDVAPSVPQKFLLPRTDAALSLESAVNFLIEKTEGFRNKGLAPEDIAFIFHRFIPATASAWSLAAPSHPTVWVDGTWGLPDGLLYFPHDSFEVSDDGRVIYRRVRCKTNVIDFNTRGGFFSREAGRPWDWKESLDQKTLRLIRDQSAAIAERLGVPAETMFFVGVPAHLAADGVLPWYFTSDIAVAEPLEKTESHFGAAHYVIRNTTDVDSFVASASSNPPWAQRVALRLDPDVGALRDRDFLDNIADAAETTGCHVEFNGSLLSHAYATLQRRGTRVRALDPGGARGERMRFNKLVRDHIPTQIEQRGEQVRTVRVTASNLERLLLRKLVEEVVEVRLADSTEARVAELADLVEVIVTIAETDGSTLDDVLAVVQSKREKRGGFSEGLFLVDTYLPSVAEASGKAEARSVEATDDGSVDQSRELPRLQRTTLVEAHAAIAHLVLPLVSSVMSAEQEAYAFDIGSGYVADVAYFADRIEVAIRRGEADQHPGQLALDIDGAQQTGSAIAAPTGSTAA
jgi:predicted house-cleaning noncanonical NTP pyrophosphatase (MazG superfamily)